MQNITVMLARKLLTEISPSDLPIELRELSKRLDGEPSIAIEVAEALLDWHRDPTGELRIAEADFAAGGFQGEEGIIRLGKIVEIFKTHKSQDLPQALVELARLRRYSPRENLHSVSEAFRASLLSAVAEESGLDPEDYESLEDLLDDHDDDLFSTPDIFDEWLDYLSRNNYLSELLKLLTEFSDPRWGLENYSVLTPLDQTLKLHGPDRALEQSREVQNFAVSAGNLLVGREAALFAARIYAQRGEMSEAIAILERAHSQGWKSEFTVDCLSKYFEDAGRYEEASDCISEWLATELGSSKLRSRRDRCDERRGLNVLAPKEFVCFSGQIRARGRNLEPTFLEQLAENAGWRAVPNVTKKCTVLVVEEVGKMSAKEKKAIQYGIKIIDGEEFVQLCAGSNSNNG